MTFSLYYYCVNAYGIYTPKIVAAVAGNVSVALSSSQSSLRAPTQSCPK